MAHVFDGQARLIYLDSATPEISVKGLYSDWKEWSNSTGLQYLQAFRSFGGDPTTTGQTAPAYYFLTNGWRVVVDGFDAILSYNLYTDEGDEPVITQNSGTAILNNSDVGIVQLNASGQQAGTSVDDKLAQLLTLVQGNADGIADIQANGTGGSGGSGGSVDLTSIETALAQLQSDVDAIQLDLDGQVNVDLTPITQAIADLDADVAAVQTSLNGQVDVDLTPITNSLAQLSTDVDAIQSTLDTQEDVDLTPVLDAIDTNYLAIGELPTAVEIADEVEGRFLFNDDGHVVSDITGAPSEKNLIRAINANFPAPVSAEAIWKAAPAWLKQSDEKTEIDLAPVLNVLSDQAEMIGAFSDALSLIEVNPQVDLTPLAEAIVDARVAIEALPISETHREALGQLQALEGRLNDIELGVIGVRNKVEAIQMPDISNLATEADLDFIRAVLERLKNYDDTEVMAQLRRMASLSAQDRIEQKVDLILDNQQETF